MRKYLLLLIAACYSSVLFGQNILQTSQSVGCAPLLVKLTSSVTHTDVVEWRWNLGDGNTSLQQNPLYVYTIPGVYTVKLTITRANGVIDSFVQPQMITVGALPTVNFSTQQTVVCNPDTVRFLNTTQANGTPIATYQWNFGDGSTSNAVQPNKVYTFADTFSVFLEATNILGCKASIEKRNYILAKNRPIAQVSLNAFNKCTAPVTVSFTNNSTSNGSGSLTYNWVMGDGTTYTTPQVTHTYATDGVYSPQVTITGSNGCSAITNFSSAIRLGGYTASFTGVDSGCLGTTQFFANTSNPTPIRSEWFVNNVFVNNSFNLTHAFTQVGIANVTVVNFYPSCTDSFSKQVIVNTGIDNLQFQASRTQSVCAPFTTNFSSNVPPSAGITYLWEFGDGSTSTDALPTHTYTSTGEFSVKLTVVLQNGCSRSRQENRFIRIIAPIISNRMSFRNGCAPHTTNLFTSVNTIVPVAYYVWDFGNGTSEQTSSVNISAFYPVEGVYNVSVTVVFADSCRQQVFMQDPVRVSSKPTANFNFTPSQGCTNTSFTFNNTSSNYTNSLWQFFNPTPFFSTTQASPDLVFSDTGTVTVRLVVSNNGCNDTASVINGFRLTPPFANFQIASVCGPSNRLARRFVNRSLSRTGTTYLWDFGDGNTSTAFSPTHLYASPGIYPVTLTATGDSCITTKNSFVRVFDDYTITISSPNACRGEPITCQLTNPAITSLNVFWDFGDGTNTILPPSLGAIKSYSTNGIYTIRAIFFNPLTQCSDTITRTNAVNVRGPVASIISNSTTPAGCAGVQVRAVADSTSGIQLYRFFWGDGNSTSTTAANASHVYSANGTYNLKLEVQGNGCTDTALYPNLFTISKVTAAFTSNATVSCPNAPIQLQATSAAGVAPLRYQWLVGGNQSFTGSSPTVRFASDGVYSVRLIVIDANNCRDTSFQPNFITIVSPKAAFTASDTALICTPTEVQFQYQGANQTQVAWSFGDGSIATILNPTKVYTTAGSFAAVLVVTSPGGCTDTAISRITVSAPQPVYSFNGAQGCMPLPVRFNNSSNGGENYVWIYGDGFTAYNTQPFVNHTYTQPGAFIPQLFVVDEGGCLVPVTITDTVKSYGAVANISSLDSFYCNQVNLPLTATIQSSYSALASVQWQSNNTTVANTPQATLPLTIPGSYTIRFITNTIENCADTFGLQPSPITLVASPVSVLQIPDSICEKITLPIQFTPAGGAANTYTWLYNGAIVSTGINTPAITTSIGSQQFALVTTNRFCSDTLRKNFIGIAEPNVFFSANSLCVRSLAQLADSSIIQNDTIIARRWVVNNRVIGTGNSASFFVPSNGNYQFQYQVQTSKGCSTSANKNVFIQAISPQITADTLTVANSPVTMQTTAFGNNLQYNWQPNVELDTAFLATATATISQSRTYRVLVTNEFGCMEADTVRLTLFSGGAEIYVATAFSPRGTNRVLRPIPVGVQLQSFTVFNRLGQIIYQSNGTNYQQGWDGSFQGSPQPAGTYVWMATGQTASGAPIRKQGTAVLIR